MPKTVLSINIVNNPKLSSVSSVERMFAHLISKFAIGASSEELLHYPLLLS